MTDAQKRPYDYRPINALPYWDVRGDLITAAVADTVRDLLALIASPRVARIGGSRTPPPRGPILLTCTRHSLEWFSQGFQWGFDARDN